jgi:hypothetical protein
VRLQHALRGLAATAVHALTWRTKGFDAGDGVEIQTRR